MGRFRDEYDTSTDTRICQKYVQTQDGGYWANIPCHELDKNVAGIRVGGKTTAQHAVRKGGFANDDGAVAAKPKLVLNFSDAPMWTKFLPLLTMTMGLGYAYHNKGNCIGCLVGFGLGGAVLGSIPLLAKGIQKM